MRHYRFALRIARLGCVGESDGLRQGPSTLARSWALDAEIVRRPPRLAVWFTGADALRHPLVRLGREVMSFSAY